MPKLLILFIACLFVSVLALGQTSFTDTARTRQPITMVVGNYQYTADEQSKLYNGPEHVDYDARTIGVPYFQSIDWLTGNLFYNGILYKNVPMKYDLVKDLVVIRHHNQFYKINLVSERVDSFFLAGHTFVRLDKSKNKQIPRTGFYDVIASGKVSFLVKREKMIAEFIESMEVRRRVDDKTDYYILNGDAFYEIGNRKDLLNVLKDKRKEVQQFIKSEKIKFRKNEENAFTAVVHFYNQLKP